MPQVFGGITVADFTRGMAGSLTTMVMSDFGADVIKVEPPGGDPFRDRPGAIQWNRGKKSVILDLKTQEGRGKAKQLAWQSDVVAENFRPGATERLGIDYESLSHARPDLVYCSLTGFGPKGPYARYKGYEGVVSAKTGRMAWLEGQNRRKGPNYTAVQLASYSAATALLRGVLAALFVRDRTGQGQKVETNLLQAITPYDHREWLYGQMMTKDPVNYPESVWLRRQVLPVGFLAGCTKDGKWLQMGNAVERIFRAMVHSLDMGYIYEDPRFKSAPRLDAEDQDSLEAMMLDRIRERTMEEWMDTFLNDTLDVAVEPYTTSEEAIDHPQILHNGNVCDVEDPRLGNTRQLGPLVTMSDTPGIPKGPAPEPGQHTEEILARLNGPTRKAPNNSALPLPRYPLEGITVLDLGYAINGPLACSLVSELGARVIRIEAPAGDYNRFVMMGLGAHRTMAGTEGTCVDLKTPEGQEILGKLVTKADVLLHAMRPGAWERTGIGYEQVTNINPRLVYVYTAGYGSTGPRALRPSMHPIPGAVCGGALAQLGRDNLPQSKEELTMDEIQEVSRKLNHANDGSPDQHGSMAASVAIMLGLYARERTGKGQYIESSLLGANAYANADDFFWHEGKPPRPIPDSEGYGPNALYRLYPAQKGWVFLACLFEQEWRALCQTVGRLDLLDDARFSTNQVRLDHDASLADELGRVFAGKAAVEWERLLTAADVACVQVEEHGMYEFFSKDVHALESGSVTEVEDPRLGRFWRQSPVVSFSHTQGRVGPGNFKGQHTQAVLRELGYDEEQILDMKERGVVHWDEL